MMQLLKRAIMFVPTATIFIPLICCISLSHNQETVDRRLRSLPQHANSRPFQCKSEGFFIDPNDCSIFYRCLDWGVSNNDNSLQTRFTSFKFQCKPDFVFEPETNSCVLSSLSSVERCRISASRSEPLHISLPRANNNPNSVDNSDDDYGVIQEHRYQPLAQQTQPSRNYNLLDPSNEQTENGLEHQSSRVARSPPCNNEGYFAIENDCGHFYRCVSSGSGFIKYEFACAEGTVWDPDSNACNHAWAVQRPDCKNVDGENAGGSGAPENNDPNSGDPNNNFEPEGYPSQNAENEYTDLNTNPGQGTGYPNQNPGNGPSSSNQDNGYPSEGQGQPGPPIQGSGYPDYGNVNNNQGPNGYPGQNTPPPSQPGPSGYPGQNTPPPSQPGPSGYPGQNTLPPSQPGPSGYPGQNTPPPSQPGPSGYPGQNTPPPSQPGPSGYPGQNIPPPSQPGPSGYPGQNTPPPSQPGPSGYPEQTTPSGSVSTPTGEPEQNIQGSTPSQSGNQTVLDSNGSCISEGFQGVTGDCKKFIRCVPNRNGFTKYEFECGEGTVWDTDAVTCNYADSVQRPDCQNGTTTNSESPNNPNANPDQQNSTPNNQQPYPTPSSSPNQSPPSSPATPISNNQTPSGSVENPQTPPPPNNNYPQPPAGGSSSSSPGNKVDQCTDEGFFPSSSDCNKFYRCVRNDGSGFTKYEFNCGPGTVYDPQNNVCNHPSAVQNEACNGGTPSSGSQNPANQPNTPETTPQPQTSPSPATTPLLTSPSSKPTTSKKPSTTNQTPQTSTTPKVTTIRPGTTTKKPTPTTTKPTPSSPTTTPTAESTDANNPNSGNATSTINPNAEPTTPANTQTSPQTTTPAKANCTEAGFFPDPNNCQKFYRCVDWDGDKKERFSVYYFDCPEGTIYDPALTTCNHAESVYPPRDCSGNSGNNSSPQVIDPASTNTPTDASPTTIQPETTPSNNISSTTPEEELTTSANSTESVTEPIATTNSPDTSTTSNNNNNQTTTIPPEATTNNNNNGESTTIPPEASTNNNNETTTIPTETSTNNNGVTTTSPDASETTTNNNNNTLTTTPAGTDTTTNNIAETTTSSIDGSTNPNTTPPSNSPITTLATSTQNPEESSTTDPNNQITTINPTTTETSTSPSQETNNTCPELKPDQFSIVCPTGFKRHPKYCNLFYQCTSSPTHEIKVLTLSCPSGNVYDEDKIQCLPQDQAKKCDGEISENDSSRSDANSIKPIPVQTTSLCPSVGSFVYKDDCSLFYKCQKNDEGKLNGFLYQCPEGFGYWTKSKRCEKIEKVPCDSGRKVTNGKLTLAPIEAKNIGNKK